MRRPVALPPIGGERDARRAAGGGKRTKGGKQAAKGGRFVSPAERGHRRAQWFANRLLSEQRMAEAIAAIGKEGGRRRARATRRRDAAWIAMEPTPAQHKRWAVEHSFARHVTSGDFHAERQSTWAADVKAQAVAISDQIDARDVQARSKGIASGAALAFARKAKVAAVQREQQLATIAAVNVVSRFMRKRRARIRAGEKRERERIAAQAAASEMATLMKSLHADRC